MEFHESTVGSVKPWIKKRNILIKIMLFIQFVIFIITIMAIINNRVHLSEIILLFPTIINSYIISTTPHIFKNWLYYSFSISLALIISNSMSGDAAGLIFILILINILLWIICNIKDRKDNKI